MSPVRRLPMDTFLGTHSWREALMDGKFIGGEHVDLLTRENLRVLLEELDSVAHMGQGCVVPPPRAGRPNRRQTA